MKILEIQNYFFKWTDNPNLSENCIPLVYDPFDNTIWSIIFDEQSNELRDEINNSNSIYYITKIYYHQARVNQFSDKIKYIKLHSDTIDNCSLPLLVLFDNASEELEFKLRHL